jgi:hypothetical protein
MHDFQLLGNRKAGSKSRAPRTPGTNHIAFKVFKLKKDIIWWKGREITEK